MIFASYNIHRCVGSDRRYDVERIAAVIGELGAHVVGLQEVTSSPGTDTDQSSLLAQMTGFLPIPGPTIVRQEGEYGNLLLTNCAVCQVEHINLSVSGREPRGAIDVLLKPRGKTIRVILTHLGLDSRERQLQVAKLTKRLHRHKDLITILFGDMNAWFPLSRPIQALHRRLGTVPALATFPSRWPLLALDRIWVRPRNALQSLAVHATPLARAASDHLPVKARITLE
jgi:endonuclease/exonuclease/phosphatase family metal-dependent hydrolase